MARSKRVVVVGGGLIGLCTAHSLLRDGHQVTIVERDYLGAGASTGNAGEVTPQQVAPLASPRMLKDVVKGVLSNDSYLSIDVRQLPQLASFGLGFLRAAGKRSTTRGVSALAQFVDGIIPALQRFGSEGIDLSGGGFGYLMTSSDDLELLEAHRRFGDRAKMGWGEAPGPVLRGSLLMQEEPVLGPTVTGGFVLPGEYSLDPVTFVSSLVRSVTSAGAEIRVGLEALRIGDGASVICRDKAGVEEVIRGDRVVLATGAWSSSILSRSGIRARRIVAGKGYSFTVPVERMPRTLVHSMDRHCLVIPMHERLRVVGLMDFDRRPSRPNADRLAVLVRSARGLIAGADWDARTDEWVGERPMTANGLPLLGSVPHRPDIVVATGHNMHGLSLGPVTAEVVSDIIAGRAPVIGKKQLDLRPFSII